MPTSIKRVWYTGRFESALRYIANVHYNVPLSSTLQACGYDAQVESTTFKLNTMDYYTLEQMAMLFRAHALFPFWMAATCLAVISLLIPKSKKDD